LAKSSARPARIGCEKGLGIVVNMKENRRPRVSIDWERDTAEAAKEMHRLRRRRETDDEIVTLKRERRSEATHENSVASTGSDARRRRMQLPHRTRSRNETLRRRRWSLVEEQRQALARRSHVEEPIACAPPKVEWHRMKCCKERFKVTAIIGVIVDADTSAVRAQ
jgi:hypothetical protein